MNYLKTTEKIYNVIRRNFAGPIMNDEIQEAIRKMKLGKATGPNSTCM